MIIANTRVLNAPITGVQRYTLEILNRLPEDQVRRVAPPSFFRRPFNLVWEQTMLPFMVGKDLLWSPANTGPVAIKNQVLTIHDLATREYPEEFSKLYREYHDWLFPRLLPKVKGVITISQYTRQRLLETYPIQEDKLCTIHLGVDHQRFFPRPEKELQEFRKRANLPSRYILYLGTLTRRKNVGLIVNGWKQAQRDVPEDVELVIGGGAALAHVFNGNTLPELPPRTRLLGRISEADLPLLMAGATVFTFPSLYEGFGLPPLEAMASGVPVIVSNVTSLPEVVGDAGITISPESIDQMANALKELLNNEKKRQTLAEKGKKRAASFTWEQTAAKTLAFFEKVKG